MTEISTISQESTKLLNALQHNNIKFAHWKGNVHLVESLEGKTDIELLIDPSERNSFESVMMNLGYKKLKSQTWNSYPQVEDWIGFDYQSGQLLHFHTHYALILAISYGNYVHLPWLDKFFEHITTDLETGWPIPEPELEAVILLIRIWTKIKHKPHKEQEILTSRRSEISELLSKSDKDHFIQICSELELMPPVDIDEKISRIIQGDILEIKYLAEMFYDQSPANKMEEDFYINLKSLYYKYHLKSTQSASVITGPVKQKKTIQNGGKIIALIGSDGSGKSTLSKDLTDWLTFKIDTHYFYLGKKPFIRSYNKQLYSKADLFTGNNSFSKVLKKLSGDFYHVIMIKHKADMIQMAKEMSRRGSIIICDRFPQSTIKGINDGPKLQRKKDNWPAKLEMKLYNQVAKVGADLIFRLQVPPEVASKRKPEHSFEMIKKKCENINKIAFKNTKIIDLDASKPYDQVLLDIKREVWKHL